MVIKVYIAMISCSQEIKKNQQRALMILESKNVPYTVVDITDPGNEEAKDYMMVTAVPKPEYKVPVTPQIFNEADYCGDYDGLDMANECDTLGEFLNLSDDEKSAVKIGITNVISSEQGQADTGRTDMSNGVSASRESSQEKAVEITEQTEEQPVEEEESPTEIPSAEETPNEPDETPKEAEITTTEAAVEKEQPEEA